MVAETAVGPSRPSQLKRFRSRIRMFSSGSFTSSEMNGNDCETNRNSKKSFSFPTSSRILTRAVNWRSKGIQAKNERRERRATKTLAIVLGMSILKVDQTPRVLRIHNSILTFYKIVNKVRKFIKIHEQKHSLIFKKM